ncbi:MAG TPA: hypothetical protein VJK26_01815 [Patescibacteria group bacterium]|nr:hypothetical protein [Patescibacteria group bacterium]
MKQPILKIILIILAVAILGTGVAYGTINLVKRKENPPSPTPTPSITPRISPTSPATTPTFDTTPKSAEVLTAALLWARRDELVGQTVIVEDVVTFLSSCPTVEGVRPEQCSTGLYLGSQEDNNFALYKNGKTITCRGMPATCEGFAKDQKKRFSGTLVKSQLTTYYLNVL